MEYQKKDLIAANENITRFYSGKSMHDLLIGLDLYRKKLGIRWNSRIPLKYNIAEESVVPRSNTSLQILYFLDK